MIMITKTNTKELEKLFWIVLFEVHKELGPDC